MKQPLLSIVSSPLKSNDVVADFGVRSTTSRSIFIYLHLEDRLSWFERLVCCWNKRYTTLSYKNWLRKKRRFFFTSAGWLLHSLLLPVLEYLSNLIGRSPQIKIAAKLLYSSQILFVVLVSQTRKSEAWRLNSFSCDFKETSKCLSMLSLTFIQLPLRMRQSEVESCIWLSETFYLKMR